MFSVLTLVVFYLDKYDIYKPFLPLNHFLSEYIIYLSKHNISYHKHLVKQNIHVSKYFILTCKLNMIQSKQKEVYIMISYKPLFRLLLERDMTKTQLREAVGFSSATLAKMSKGEYISLETVENICKYLNCKIEDVIEIQ